MTRYFKIKKFETFEQGKNLNFTGMTLEFLGRSREGASLRPPPFDNNGNKNRWCFISLPFDDLEEIFGATEEQIDSEPYNA